MISTYLKQNNITCYALAKKSGISYTTLNELIRGERNINDCTVNVLQKLAKALNLSLENTIKICLKREKIPNSLSKCFWDSDFKNINPIMQINYVVPRLLEYGLLEGIIYVEDNYFREELKSVAINSRTMSPKIANYLSLICDVKRDDMRYYKYSQKDWR